VVDSLKALDLNGRLEKPTSASSAGTSDSCQFRSHAVQQTNTYPISEARAWCF
jgi:hypothetical protein